jgi:SAM-dependent methyltransferase
MSTNEDTVKSYDASAAEYAEEAAAMPEWVAREIDAFVVAVGGTGRILEIGSGGGRDARALEGRGLSVRCTDVAQGFVDLLHADGFEADRLDPLTDDLADPQRPDTPYDGVWSCACLFDVARDDLVTVLGRLAEATRSAGRIHGVVQRGRRQRSVRLQHRSTPALHRHAVAGAGPARPVRCRWVGRGRNRFPWRQAVARRTRASTVRTGYAATTACSSPGRAGDRPAADTFDARMPSNDARNGVVSVLYASGGRR